ncbi:MAG: BON domain-containing protein [Desulfovibrio sp.]|nr:BON domain-containing protein [Desulfovibrio sp.]
MTRLFQALAAVCLAGVLQGCAIWGGIEDERLMDTMASDKAVSLITKNNLMAEKLGDGWNINVYTYYGHVFLVGECPEGLRAKMVEIARRDNRVRSVTPHWFEKPAKKLPAGAGDFKIGSNVRFALIGAKELSSTRVDTETNAGRVVLLGVVASEKEKQIAIKAAQNVQYVQSVTSYLFESKQGTELGFTPAEESYPGTYTETHKDFPGERPHQEATPEAAPRTPGDEAGVPPIPESPLPEGGEIRGRDI